MKPTTISTREVLCLQAVSRLRWQLLLDVPSLAETVDQVLRPVAVCDPRLARELSTWLRSCRSPFPLDEYGRRTRRLANAARRADPLGHRAMMLLRMSRQRLSDDGRLAARIHAEALATATERYVAQRNDLALRGSELILAVIARSPIVVDDRADAFQEGVLGLIAAFERFAPSKHVSFNLVAREHVLRRLRAFPIARARPAEPPHGLEAA